MAKANDTKYKNDFQKEKYDRIIVNVEKGKKEIIEQHRTKKGYRSLNAYINDLIDQDMTQKPNIQINKIKQKGDNNIVNIN